MTSYRSLNHTKWACQYHVVFIPKYRKKAIYADLRRYLGDVLRRLAQRRESEVEEGHLMVDHVHLMLSIPPKYSVADVIGYIKGKSAIHIARRGAAAQFRGAALVSTVGRDELGPGTRRSAVRATSVRFKLRGAAAQFRGAALLSSRLLRVHGGAG